VPWRVECAAVRPAAGPAEYTGVFADQDCNVKAGG